MKNGQLTIEDFIRVRDYLLSPKYTKDRLKAEEDFQKWLKWREKWLNKYFGSIVQKEN